MGNHYLDRDSAKAALATPVNSTADDAVLDTVIEGVSRLLDDYAGLPLYAHQATKYFTAQESECLHLPEPLTAVTSVRTDPGGARTYSSTMSATCYDLTGAGGDYNARSASPARPYWELHIRQNSSLMFPTGTPFGVEITGTFGYTNQTRVTGTLPSSSNGWDATSTSLTVQGASNLHSGQTLLVDSEQLFLREQGTASNILVERGVNGTSGAAHTSAAAINVYEYPVVSEAARFQVALTWRAKDMSGYGGDNGVAARTPSGGLHPFTRSMLTMRKPVSK